MASRWPIKPGPDDDTALKHGAAFLQSVGIFEPKTPSAWRLFGLACIDEFPIIYVNNTNEDAADFTLFHELGHLLFHTSGNDMIDNGYIPALHGQQRRIDRLQPVRRRIPRPRAARRAMVDRDRSEQTVEQIAQQFWVSREDYRKFLDRGWIDHEYNARRANGWPEGKGGGGDYYNNQITYLGRLHALALQQYYNRIDDAQLAKYLNTSPNNVGTLEEYFRRQLMSYVFDNSSVGLVQELPKNLPEPLGTLRRPGRQWQIAFNA